MKAIEKDTWIRPWNIEKFDNLSNRDERFFAIICKGILSWLEENIYMYNKPIKHYIFNTGSSYLYIENNGYEFSMNETSGEDQMYMEMPRCIVEISDISVSFNELTSPFVRGTYERMSSNNEIQGYNAQMRRLPIEWNINLHYILSNFNESIILIQEILDKLSFQQYFNVAYLGQIIECSVEIPSDFSIQINKIDMTASEANQKTIDISIKLSTNYPIINERTEISNSHYIGEFVQNDEIHSGKIDSSASEESNRGSIKIWKCKNCNKEYKNIYMKNRCPNCGKEANWDIITK